MNKQILLLLETNKEVRTVSTLAEGLYYVDSKAPAINAAYAKIAFYLRDDETDHFQFCDAQLVSIYDIHINTIFDNKPYKVYA